MMQEALHYAEEGHPVLPIAPGGKIPLARLVPRGKDDATVDKETITAWWQAEPRAGVGIRCDGLLVIDIDGDPGEQSLVRLTSELGALPKTLEQRTGGGGRHLLYRLPEGATVGNSTASLGKPEGIHIRGADHGYIVVAPTVHPSGKPYRWLNSAPIADAPPWLLGKLTERPNRLSRTPAREPSSRYGLAALDQETAAVRNTPEGGRNERLNEAAFAVGQLESGGELQHGLAETLLLQAAVDAGLSELEARRTIQSGLEAGRLLPRQASEPLARPVPRPKLVEAPPASPLRIVSLQEFVSVTEDSAKPLIGTDDDNLLPVNGLLLMYGDGGAGKTVLSIDAVAHLGSGTDWLDQPIPKPVRVLLIENEGPRGPFRRILAKKAANWKDDSFSQNVHVLEEPWTRFTLADESFRHGLAEQIDLTETDVVVVGPLASIGAKGGGTPDDITEFGDLIADLKSHTERDFALWIVHHENKAGDVSGAWERVPDTLVHVSNQGNGRTRVNWRKVRWSSSLHNTTVQLLWADNAGFTVDEARERDYPAELYEAFSKDNRWRTATEAAGLVAANKDRVKEALSELVESGDMVFEIGPKGRSPIAHCWKLTTGSEARSQSEPQGVLQVLGGRTGSLARSCKEPVEPGQYTSDPDNSTHPPEPVQKDNPEDAGPPDEDPYQ